VLHAAGAAVTACKTVRVARTHLDEEQYDALVSDYLLETGTSAGLVERAAAVGLPVIVVTGTVDEVDAETRARAPVYEKPITNLALVAAVLAVLKR
jgi:DNA-binding NtrC family response regulator